jgi:hypothetical protein
LGDLHFCKLSDGEVGYLEVDVKGFLGVKQGVPEGLGTIVDGVDGCGS